MKQKNKTIGQIFAKNKLSRRFYSYQNDPSKRGRSLFLNQILMHLKNEFEEHKTILDQAISLIKINGIADDKKEIEWIIKSMRKYAATVSEISDETHLSKSQVQKHLKSLLKEKKVRFVDHPTKDNRDRTDWRDRMWFLNE